MARTEFAPRVKLELAERAGHECSHPTCPARTSGPRTGPRGSQRLGEAAHIYPASPAGPRSRFRLPRSLSVNSPENGIWLCPSHARLVDKHRGDDFPPFVLLAWKSLQETRVALDQGIPRQPVGWIHSLEIERCGFLPSKRLVFGPANWILGSSGSGKTAILRFMFGEAPDIAQFAAKRHGPLAYELQWFDPHLRRIEVEAKREGEITFRMGNNDFGVRPTKPTSVVSTRWYPESVADLADSLGLSAADISALAPLVGRRSAAGLRSSPVEILQHVDDELRTERGLRLAQLSGGEQAILALEFAAHRACSFRTVAPIALAIDPWPGVIDSLHAPALSVWLGHITSSVQVFITASDVPRGFDLSGWTMLRIDT